VNTVVQYFDVLNYLAKGRSNDEWSAISRCRQYILSQVDAANIVPLLLGDSLTSSQRSEILNDPVRERRTETLLEMLETKPNSVHHMFIEAIGELYPHVYLELTGKGDDDDGNFNLHIILRIRTTSIGLTSVYVTEKSRL